MLAIAPTMHPLRHVIVNAMKLMVWLGIAIGGTLGGFIGGIFDHGNWLGGWSILLSSIGSLLGVWAGYKLGKLYF